MVRDGKLIMDDSDSYGVEMGLQLVEQAGGGDVTLVPMAPNGETSGLRTALAMGAARPSSSATLCWPVRTPSVPPRSSPRPSSEPTPI